MKTLTSLAALLMMGSCAAQPGEPSADRGDAPFSEALRGRVAGAELGCINVPDLRRTRTASGSEAILFEARGGVIYLNTPRGACPAAGRDFALSTMTPSGRLCEGDIVQFTDRASGLGFGGCSLGRFTPYHRAGGR